MGKLFDDISRTLATPMPRMTAIRLILGGIAGVILAPFGRGQGVDPIPGAPRIVCSEDSQCADNGSNKICCAAATDIDPSLRGPICCAHPLHCCGEICCPPPKVCEEAGVCADKPATGRRP